MAGIQEDSLSAFGHYFTCIAQNLRVFYGEVSLGEVSLGESLGEILATAIVETKIVQLLDDPISALHFSGETTYSCGGSDRNLSGDSVIMESSSLSNINFGQLTLSRYYNPDNIVNKFKLIYKPVQPIRVDSLFKDEFDYSDVQYTES